MSKPEVTLPIPPPDDLVVEDITIGDGPEASAGNLVEVHYVGVALSNGVSSILPGTAVSR